jgi:hypothetical protein
MASATAAERVRPFVGREMELLALSELVQGEETQVVCLHGIAGVGKSGLVCTFLDRARRDSSSVIHLDCRTVEPTERGFLRAAGGVDALDAFVRHLQALPAPIVLALDHYEVFRLMDTWLRQVLVPALPPGVGLLLAGRERPVAAWFGLERFRTLPLGPLEDAEALSLLERHGIGARDANRLNRIARGHPLALVLASAGVSEHPELEFEDAAMTREDGGGEALRRLLELPFVDGGRDGLIVHEAVRDAMAGFLRGTDPTRYRRYRRAAWRELRAEIREAGPTELWRYTADMLYLIDNPVVREAFFPTGTQPIAVEPAGGRDASAVREIAHRHEGPEAAALLDRWWEEAPEMFSVVRERDGAVAGFFALVDGGMLHPSLVAGDPILETWTRDLHDRPLPKGQLALGLRRWLDAERGEGPCPSQAACWLDVKRTYMALRPALRRMYVVVRDVPGYWPVVERLGFRPFAGSASLLDGVEYTSVVLDFGPGSVDGWLAALVADELGLGRDDELDETSLELRVQGAPVALTPLEFGLFRHLRDREGRSVSRGELLHEVWHTDFTGGSNVVDAVVRSLRHKLGRESAVVETVRGSGYRLRADWRAHLN